MPASATRCAPCTRARAEVHEDDASAVFAHDVLRLDVAVDEAGAVHGGKRAAQIARQGSGLARAERAVRCSQRLERPAADELHPQADAAVADVGAMDGDHVRMADAGERARFVEQPIRLSGRGVEAQELERDFTIEVRIPGAKHVAECASGNPLLHFEVSPRAGGRQEYARRGPAAAAASSSKRSVR